MSEIKYNIVYPPGINPHPIMFELDAFWRWQTPAKGGLGRYRHFKNAMTMLWPNRVWTPWDDIRARVFCDERYWSKGDQWFHAQGNVGCAASGKTDFWASAAMLWWMADPLDSAVVITSIHKEMIRQRSWAVIQNRYNEIEQPDRPGHFIDSRMTLQASKGDEKHSVKALAVGRGETAKAKQVIAGLHTKRIMLVIDEAPGTPEAIFHVIPNIRKACNEFVVIAVGNAISRLDAHGRMCEPLEGWDSVDEDSEVWLTKGIPEWSIDPGVTVHFHGKRSPNVKSGRTIYDFLYTYENWQEDRKKQDTLSYWTYSAGFWPPEGLSNTVLDEPTIVKCGGMDRVTWLDQPINVAALDPAFGGDDCVLRLGKIGTPTRGPRCLELGPKFVLKIRSKVSEPVHYQVARQVREICEANRVEGINFGLDCTGNGGGVASILEAEWSPMIHKVEFGGAPTDMPVSASDSRPAKEVYDRRVTELWFRVRNLVEGGQLKGLDTETVVQFTSRVYTEKTKKKSVERKDEMKQRIGRSPDDADCVSVLVDLACRRGLVATGVQWRKPKADVWLQEARKVNGVYDVPDPFEQPEIAQPSYMSWLSDD